MKWTSHHKKLLLALRAQQLIPKLHRRLTFERYVPSDDDLRRLLAWPDALSKDPGWPRLAAVLDQPDAWPTAWHQATEMGWSPKTDHHNALFFGRISDRFAQDEDYENALWAWTEAISAWARVMTSSYPNELLADLVPEADEESLTQHRTMLKTLLSPLVTDKAQALRDALRLDDDRRKDESIDRRLARFAWSALDMIHLIHHKVDTKDEPFGVIKAMTTKAQSQQETLRVEAIMRFERVVDALDLTLGEKDPIAVPFEWVSQVFEMIGTNAYASIAIIEKTVELGWRLRKLGLDDDNQAFEHILQLVNPINDDLIRRIKSLETFGHNSKCADFLVFRGELATGTENRKRIFLKGMDVCPGHRNSAMLLSYEQLSEAHILLIQVKLVPGSVSRTLSPSKHVASTVLKAWDKVLEAQDTYPSNKEIETYIERVEATAKRLGVKLPSTRTDETSGDD